MKVLVLGLLGILAASQAFGSIITLAGSGTCSDASCTTPLGVSDPLYLTTTLFNNLSPLVDYNFATNTPQYPSLSNGALTLNLTPNAVDFNNYVTPSNSGFVRGGGWPAGYFFSNDLTIALVQPVPVFGFDAWELVGSPQFDGAGLYTVTFHGSSGGQAQQQFYMDLFNNQAFMAQFAAQGTGGELISSVNIHVDINDFNTFGETPSVGAFRYDLAATPEPASVLLIGGALLGLGVVSRRRLLSR